MLVIFKVNAGVKSRKNKQKKKKCDWVTGIKTLKFWKLKRLWKKGQTRQ